MWSLSPASNPLTRLTVCQRLCQIPQSQTWKRQTPWLSSVLQEMLRSHFRKKSHCFMFSKVSVLGQLKTTCLCKWEAETKSNVCASSTVRHTLTVRLLNCVDYGQVKTCPVQVVSSAWVSPSSERNVRSQKAQPVCRETVQTLIPAPALKCLGTLKQCFTSSFSSAPAAAASIPLTLDQDIFTRISVALIVHKVLANVSFFDFSVG